jgi:arylsulfatase
LNAPFPWCKQVASHLGGITDPLVVDWPDKIKAHGEVRGQFSHIVDIAPTIYQAAGITPPDIVNGIKQVPLEGKSLVPTFTDAAAQTGHTLQYFELVGNRGIYKDGWFAGKRFLLPWESGRPDKWADNDPDKLHPWELYNLNEDYSQAHNLADQQPQKLAELINAYDSEARRNNAYPTAPLRLPQPSPAQGKTFFTYYADVTRLPIRVLPALNGRSHVLTADIDVPAAGASGVIAAEGGRYGGFSLYIKDGTLIYENNVAAHSHELIKSGEALPEGHVHAVYEFTAASSKGPKTLAPAGGHGRLSVNGKLVGEGDLSSFGGFGETFDIGSDLGSPVSDAYETPATFTGKIEKVTLQLK